MRISVAERDTSIIVNYSCRSKRIVTIQKLKIHKVEIQFSLMSGEEKNYIPSAVEERRGQGEQTGSDQTVTDICPCPVWLQSFH